MARIYRGSRDRDVLALKAALEDYERSHPGAEASLYRLNGSAVRIRVVDGDFRNLARSRRHDLMWDFLAGRIGDATMSEVSVLLLLDPSDIKDSLMNLEFEQPLPSRL